MVQKTGLQAIFETSSFTKGLEIYKRGISEVIKKNEEAAKSSSNSGKTFDETANKWRDDVSGKFVAGSNAMSGAITGISIGALAAIGAIALLVKGLYEAAKASSDFVSESIQLASRWSELDMVAQLMGQRFGMTSEEVHALTQEMQDAGIRADVASKAISQFVRMEMNPQMALELGKAAQNLAILAQDGADSSEVMDNLMLGIQRLSPIILRTAGANVDLDNSYKQFAETMGIVGRELTQVEKQQAAYNAVLESAATVAGAYDVAMENAGKQMRSLTGREIPTLMNAVGAPFQGAFLNVAKAAREVVSTFTDAISEGGALYPVMVKLGAIADIITEALANLATNGAQAVVNFFSWLADTFGGGASDAFDWGFELVVQFAQGIIDAAASVLVTAINFLGSILAGWLAPGSPPKVAPDIIKWGVGAMTEYLKGFTKADFSVLKDIQNPLKSALDLMVQQGDLTKKASVKTFLNLSKELAKALESGTADDSLFSRIAKEAGEFGKEIAKLARDEFALAKASDEVAEAQERVNEALEKQQGADKAVRDLTDEYNRLLRAGASDEVLKAQLAQINAAEEQAILAGEEKKAAEDGLSEKEDALAVLKEQVALQKDLVNQLLELARMAIVPKETVPGGAGGAGVPEPPGGGGLGVDPDAIKNKMKEAIDAAIADMKSRWSAYWGAFRAIMIGKLAIVKANLLAALQGHGGVIIQAWENFKKTVSDALTWMQNEIREWGAYFEQWWADHGSSVQTIVSGYWAIIAGIYSTGLSGLSILLISWSPILLGLWNTFMGGLQVATFIGWELLKGIIKVKLEEIGTAIDFFADILSGNWDTIKDTAIAKWTELGNSIKGLLYGLAALLKTQVVLKFIPVGKNIIFGLIDGITSVGGQLIDHLVGLILDAIEAVMNKLKSNSPSMVFFDIGVNMIKGLDLGVDSMLNSAVGTMENAMNDIIGAASPSQSIIQPSSTRIMNVNQQNNIQSPMDLATFTAMFNQVVRSQFQGA